MRRGGAVGGRDIYLRVKNEGMYRGGEDTCNHTIAQNLPGRVRFRAGVKLVYKAD